MNIKKLLKPFLLILTIDILLMTLWVWHIEPDIFMSGSPQGERLKIYIVNTVIAFLLLFINKRLAALFAINIVVCAIIFTGFFHLYLYAYPFDMKEYSFSVDSEHYILHIEENPDSYSIRNIKDSVVLEYSSHVLRHDSYNGYYKQRGDSLKLIEEFWSYHPVTGEHVHIDTVMYFYEDKLLNFPKGPSEIQVHKLENW